MLCGTPSFTFVAVCLLLNIPIFYTLTFYSAPIFCSSLFPLFIWRPAFFHFFFFLFSILTPLFAYLIFYHSYYLTALPFCFILLSFLCFVAPLPSPFGAVCLCLYIPIFAILALLSFLLQFLSFKSLSICHLFYFSFPFLPFYVPFSLFRLLSFLFSFSFPFPLPFSSFPPSSLSSSFLLPLFDAPFGRFLAPPCGHSGSKRTLCTPQDTPLVCVVKSGRTSRRHRDSR